MTTRHDSFTAQQNGAPATNAELATMAFAGFAHFTAMQVRGGRVRGLDLHLQRLRHASLAMFGSALEDEEIRGYLRQALGGNDDCSLTATLHLPGGEFAVPGREVKPKVLVRTAPPASGPAGPLELAMFEHERVLPEWKHVGEVAKTWFLRQAVSQGFDDAAFVDRHGRLSEATIWNLAFWDGESVIWPEAAMLAGTTMGILRRQLLQRGVPQRTQEVRAADVPSLKGAVVMNSWSPGIPVSRLGSHRIPQSPQFLDLLHRAFGNEEAVELAALRDTVDIE
jgi:branched-subunit amino acid aminotransferase/4-amino-4-deoxychorismate lyase